MNLVWTHLPQTISDEPRFLGFQEEFFTRSQWNGNAFRWRMMFYADCALSFTPTHLRVIKCRHSNHDAKESPLAQDFIALHGLLVHRYAGPDIYISKHSHRYLQDIIYEPVFTE